ncbi:MAG: permease-like cell division protein FtsX [Nitrospirota bacterium]
MKYFLTTALKNLWESKITSFFTAVTLAVALGFLGAYLTLFLNLQGALSSVNEKFPLTVYLSDGITAAQMDAINKRLNADPLVASVAFTSKDKALKEFSDTAADETPLIKSIGMNPLPASFDIGLKAAGGGSPDDLIKALRTMAGVEDVQYLREEAGRLKRMLDSFKFAGLALGLAVLVGVVFISYSTLRLAVLRHQGEIEVMKLLGSTRPFIMGPFLAEGALQGLMASGLSVGLLYAAVRWISVSKAMPVLDGGIRFLPPAAWLGIIFVGTFLGFTGSFLAFFRTLKM